LEVNDCVHQIGASFLLVVLTVWLQCGGIATLINSVRGAVAAAVHKLRRLRATMLFTRITTALIAMNGLQVLLWACCYRWRCFRSSGIALYFSESSHATVGCADIVLPSKWRMLGLLESVMGVLMCGLSVSLMFALAARLIGHEA
jgi:voltage-gated potassium channel